ncbi:MAG: hypothetical protein AB7E85_04330 [Pseudobdellovibrionaceae bacterium]
MPTQKPTRLSISTFKRNTNYSFKSASHMVLFNDTEPKSAPTLFGTIVKWLFRLVLILVCFIAFFIGALNLLHGKGEAQRRGLEGALADVTGLQTEIGALNEFKLFPRLIVDVSDVTLSDPNGRGLVAHIDYMRFAAPGVIVLTRSNRFSNLEMSHLVFFENGLPALDIGKVAPKTDPETKKTKLVMEGEVKKSEPFNLSTALDTLVAGKDENALYAFATRLPFTLDQGKDSFAGKLYAGPNGFVLSGAGHFDANDKEKVDVACLMADLSVKAFTVQLANLIMVDAKDAVARGKGTYDPATGWSFYLDPTPEIQAAPLDADELDQGDPCREALTK